MKRILICIAPIIFIIFAFRPFYSHKVTGNVTDENGTKIPGAIIVFKGTSHATSTDVNGMYSITLPRLTGTLIFSAVGFEPKEVLIKGLSIINISLKSAVESLQEVVVTGLGTHKKKDRIGSVAIIQTYPYNNSGMPDIQLQGRVADVNINPANGNAGAANKIMIRGISSINANHQGYYNKPQEDVNREGYDQIVENTFLQVTDNPLSTFSIDVDAASYSNVRRFLNQGQLPPAGAVRIEEMINYFHYQYPQPLNDDPFSINTEMANAPWNKDHKLVLIGLQGKKILTENLPASNLVFLIDVSGSMQGSERIGLVKASMKMLVDQLREQDKVSIVVYAGAAGLVLPTTSGANKTTIKEAIDNLETGGSTAGGAGIKLAYKTAKESFVPQGNNRVILCTDGDFNVGESSDDAMERLIEEERESGIFLTVLGYGMGNYQDAKMQKLADKGNGNHAYIDGISEAKKVLVNEFGGTLFTIAKDVKLQIEFNPAKVMGYRLIGYENRMLAKEDFNNDKKDAGELGSGHTVTALYEIIPVGVNSNFLNHVDPLKYQKEMIQPSKTSETTEMMTIKFRYKAPDGDISKLIEHPVLDKQIAIEKTSDNFRFAASVAQFGMILLNSAYKSNSSYLDVLNLARKAKGNDEEGYRYEFIRLVERAQLLTTVKPGSKTEEDDTESRPVSKNK